MGLDLGVFDPADWNAAPHLFRISVLLFVARTVIDTPPNPVLGLQLHYI